MEREALSVMEKKVEWTMLLALYGDMLTDNQREMARLHWEEDLTLAEIAQQFSVSRQSVHDTVTRTEKQLEAIEEKLGLLRRERKRTEDLLSCRQALDQVVPTPDTEQYLRHARALIASLLDQEDQ